MDDRGRTVGTVGRGINVNIGTLFFKELRFHPASLALGILAVAAASASVIGSRAFLAAHDIETERLAFELEERVGERMAELRNDARVFSKSLGFNILILPEEQDVGELYARNESRCFFTEKQAEKLGKAKLATLNHLLPILRNSMQWDEYGGEVIVVGVRGEIYIKAPNFQKPIEEPIEPGYVHLGDAIRQRLNINEGEKVKIKGRAFTVRRFMPQKGNVDDISILMNLDDAQELFGLEDRITGILALSCTCAEGDMDLIKTEVERYLQGVQIVEFTVQAQARKRAREAIAQRSREEMEDIQANRAALRAQAKRLAAILVSVVTGGAVILLAALTLGAARERRGEVAMLRALGVGSWSIFALFLYKSFLIGITGGVMGCAAGLAAGVFIAGPGASLESPLYVATIAGATLIALAASAVPAALAAGTDPAVILNQE